MNLTFAAAENLRDDWGRLMENMMKGVRAVVSRDTNYLKYK